ncbi:MAG: hybrid sensor histidine kinase/response regulator [bacterium]
MNGTSLILCVDDEPMMLDIIEGHLHGEGYELQRYCSGTELLQDSDALSRCDMVLLDVMMPDIDGFEVTRRLRDSQQRFLPVILVTALGSTEYKVRGLDSGATDFISKPVCAEELRARVRAHLRAKQMHDELARVTAIKDRLVSMVVHDIRNPLTSIVMALSLIEETEDPTLIDRTIWERAGIQTRAALELCEQLLDIKQHESGGLRMNLWNAHIGQTIEEAIHSLDGEISHRQAVVSTRLEDTLVRTDHAHLRRVVMNLLHNSLKYSEAGSSIEVRSVALQDRVRITISDHGGGIDAAELDNIFELYRTNMERPSQGRGIGLAFCKMVVEELGGRISVISEPGEGSRFQICLPTRSETVCSGFVED